jgi:hypothetical protein
VFVFVSVSVSFEGRDRFVTNLANLGSFITNYSTNRRDDSPNPSESFDWYPRTARGVSSSNISNSSRSAIACRCSLATIFFQTSFDGSSYKNLTNIGIWKQHSLVERSFGTKICTGRSLLLLATMRIKRRLCYS